VKGVKKKLKIRVQGFKGPRGQAIADRIFKITEWSRARGNRQWQAGVRSSKDEELG